MKKQAAGARPSRRWKQVFPRGWNEERVRKVIEHYDKQTEDGAVAEYEAAMKVEGLTVMLVPTELVPRIRRLIGRQRGA